MGSTFDPKQTSIVFVNGQWHSEFHITPCLPALDRAGYRVLPYQLLSVGIKETRPTFADEVENILSKIRSEVAKGQRVCVVAHSAGGMPSAEAINKILAESPQHKERIHLVFLASFFNGPRIMEDREPEDRWVNVDTDAWIYTPSRPEHVFYNDMSVEDSRPYVEALQPAMMWRDHVGTSSDEWKSVRKTYIVCLQDLAILAKTQRSEVEENGFESVEMDAGHCPFISQPEKFVDTLDRILRS